MNMYVRMPCVKFERRRILLLVARSLAITRSWKVPDPTTRMFVVAQLADFCTVDHSCSIIAFGYRNDQ
ncbi:hypothetical protein B5K06_15795 [Rhizobium grahamii]|uniref:Uncharacterized protein n=1 Tax=Rhizobium grahamii TaxID=1120045 RepID=A0A370KNK5_9HYPH|nr:hypothetical protein B5K06_15795 [Rhizobium grahamii]